MIHFSHGNGFPTETYHQVIKGLRKKANLDVGYISCLGHNPDYPVINDWSYLVDETIDYIEKIYKRPVIGIGHSLGGVVTYGAALKRPDLFKAVILLDSPLYSTWKLKSIAIIKALGLVDYLTPARVTRYRRFTWPSHEAAMEHFAKKRVFRYFDKQCLRDYVYLGTVPTGNNGEVTLRFNRMIEWQIYKTLPHIKMDKLANIPCGLIYAQFSKVIRPLDAKVMVHDYNLWCHRLDNCGHLFPFEKPSETVDAILKFLDTL